MRSAPVFAGVKFHAHPNRGFRRILIVFLVITGSIWIIANLNSNRMPMSVQ